MKKNLTKTTDIAIVKDTIVNLVPAEIELKEELVNLVNSSFNDSYKALDKWKHVLDIEVTDENDTEKMNVCREIRLAIVSNRTNTNRIREYLKEDSLKYGKAIQGAYNAFLKESDKLEEHARQQEEFLKRKEKERKDLLKAERIAKVDPYIEFVPLSIDFGEMSEDESIIFLDGLKLQLGAKQKRLAEEAELKIQQEKENAKLKNELEVERRRLIEEAKLRVEQEKENAKLKSELEESRRQVEIKIKPQTVEQSFEALRLKIAELKDFMPSQLKSEEDKAKLEKVKKLLRESYILLK